MKADFIQANFENGLVTIITTNCAAFGYPNSLYQYQTAQTLSMPTLGTPVNIDIQNDAQVMVTGYRTSIIDYNYAAPNGEFTSYSSNWYASTRVSGVEIQQAQTANIENTVMGQSTNSVLVDIMSLIVEIINYLGTHTHTYSPGEGTPTPTTVPIQPLPNDSQVVNDQSYIQDNKNLAITGVYEPYSSGSGND